MQQMYLLPIPPNSNPFDHDCYNMGTAIGNNLVVMYDVHENKRADYIIVVNKETGERLRLEF